MPQDMTKFDATRATLALVEWIQKYFLENGPTCKAVVGISGGKDSSVVAALCVKALGADNVIAVKMPQYIQSDIDCANKLIEHLQIPEENVYEINIGDIVDSIYDVLGSSAGFNLTTLPRVTSNTPARVRMTILYAIAAARHGRVANTCNYSEDYVGYATKFGDSAGDFAPLHKYTVTEVKAIGYVLELPEELIEKVPEDGLCGLPDEINLGFTYSALDGYLRHTIPSELPYDVVSKVETMHKRNLHKLYPMPEAPLYGKTDYDF